MIYRKNSELSLIMDYKFDSDSEEEEPNFLNVVFILKDENYHLTSGRIYLKNKKPIRLLKLLRNPGLAKSYNNNLFLNNTSLYNSNTIIIKNPIFGERSIDISTIVIAYENQLNNITDTEIKEIDNLNSLCKKERVSLSTKDNHTSEFSVSGESFSIKDKLNNDLNYNQVIFAYLTNPTIAVSDNWIENYLIKISQSWDMLINLKYFKLE